MSIAPAIEITELESEPRPANWVFWLAIPLILVGVWLRLWNVLEIPMFIDEIRHIQRAQEILTGELFRGLDQNKWLWGFIYAGLNPTGPEAGWLARYFNTLWACISIAGCIYLGRILGSRWVGLLAGLIYVVVPLATFHERQALVDPMMTALTTLSMVVSVSIARASWRRGSPITVLTILLIGSLLAARLVKLSMLPFLVLPLVAILLFGVLPTDSSRFRWMFTRWNRAYTALVIWILAVGVTLVGTGAVYRFADNQFDTRPVSTHTASIDNTILTSDPNVAQGTLAEDIAILAGIVIDYMGWVVVAGLGLALLFAVILRYRWRSVLYLIFPAIVFMAIPLVADRPTGSGEIASRYLLLNTSALVVLAAIGIGALANQLKRVPYVAPLFGAAVVAGVLYQNLQFHYTMVTNPRQANWAAYDQRVYFESGSSGYYFQPAGDWLLRTYERSDAERLHILSDVDLLRYATTTLGPRVGEMQFLVQEDFDEQREEVAEWMIAGDEVYVLENTDKDNFVRDRRPFLFPVGPEGMLLDRVYTWRTPEARQNAYRVVGAADPLASYIYDQLGDDPELYIPDYEIVGPVVSGSPADIVAVFPAEHTTYLAQRTTKPVIRLPVIQYPLSTEEILRVLDVLDLPPGTTLGILVFDPPTTDPQRIIETTMFETAFLMGREFWSGPANYRVYTLESFDIEPQQLDVEFEDAITLEAVTFRRPRNNVLQIEVQWQTNTPVEDEFFTFTHVVDSDGNLIVQRDGIPGGGLLPTTIWEVGVPVNDRYAIELPPNLPGDTYDVITGIYNPISGLRLQVTSGNGEVDHAILGTFTLSD